MNTKLLWVMRIKFRSQLNDEKFYVNCKTVRLVTLIEITDVYCENIFNHVNILRGQNEVV